MNKSRLYFIFSVFIIIVSLGFAEETRGYPCQAEYEACLEACPSLGCQDKCADDYLFNCPEEKKPSPSPRCTPKTTCVRQYCQYGGDLQQCTATKIDCFTSSYTTGSCNAEPPPPVKIPTPKISPAVKPTPLSSPEAMKRPSLQTPEGQCDSWAKSGTQRYRGDEMSIMTDVPSVECEVRIRVSLQSGPRQDIIENRYRYFYEGKQFCKEIIRFTNRIESARGKDCAVVPTETETRKLEFGKDVQPGDIVPLQENTRYVLVMPAGRVFVKETKKQTIEGPFFGAVVITEKKGMIEMSLEDGFYYFLFKKTLESFSGESEGTMEPLIFTRLAALRMKGTEFSVNVAPDGTTAVHVLDGEVVVSDRTSGQNLNVAAGFGTIVIRDKPVGEVGTLQVRSGDYEPWWEEFPKITPEPSERRFGITEFIIIMGITAGIIWMVVGIRYFVRKSKRGKV